MNHHRRRSNGTADRLARAGFVVALALVSATNAWSCALKTSIRPGTAEALDAYFTGKRATVVTFLGYSGAGYEDQPAMVKAAGRVLDRYSAKNTIVNVGATAEGIGAVYALAKQKGFRTVGIVSTQAKEGNVPLSPCVDVVFYVPDSEWGGIDPRTGALSPTSAAMVRYSNELVAIGGGEIARDELLAARQAQKRTQFIAADMNHRIALDKAQKKGQPPPTEFGGAAAAAFR